MAARTASRFATAWSMSAATAIATSAFSHARAMSRGVEPPTTTRCGFSEWLSRDCVSSGAPRSINKRTTASALLRFAPPYVASASFMCDSTQKYTA